VGFSQIMKGRLESARTKSMTTMDYFRDMIKQFNSFLRGKFNTKMSGLTFDVQIDEMYACIWLAGTWFSIAGPWKEIFLPSISTKAGFRNP
jgi:hypothetical protein